MKFHSFGKKRYWAYLTVFYLLICVFFIVPLFNKLFDNPIRGNNPEFYPKVVENMKIYVWPIGNEFNLDLNKAFWEALEDKTKKVVGISEFNYFEYLQTSERKRAFISMFLQEPYIHSGLEKFATKDINSADLFYIPFYFGYFGEICRLFDSIRRTTMNGESYKFCDDDPFQNVMEDIMKTKQWLRGRGSDFLFTCPYNFCFDAKKSSMLKNSIIIGLDNSKQYKISEMIEKYKIKRYPSSYENKHLFKKFITMPMCVNQPDWFILKSLRKNIPPTKRDIFLYFAGRRGSSKALRDRLTKGLADKPDSKFLLLWKDDNTKSLSHTENVKFSLRSTFCLCPHGSAPVNRRLYESIIAGCIPVILSDMQSLPFELSLGKYSKFTVMIPEATPAEKVWEILKSYSREEIQAMRENLESIWFYYTFHDSQKDPSAMDLIIPELALFAADQRKLKIEHDKEDLFLSKSVQKTWRELAMT